MPFELLRDYGPTKGKPTVVEESTVELPGSRSIVLKEAEYIGDGGDFRSGVRVKGRDISIGKGRADEGNSEVLLQRDGKHVLLKKGETAIVSFGFFKNIKVKSV